MTSLRRDLCHSDPGNWVGGFLYFCKQDRRILVPKRLRGLGWTLNFARPLAWPILLLPLGVAIAPLELWKCLHLDSHTVWLLIRIFLVAGMLWTCFRLSSPLKR